MIMDEKTGLSRTLVLLKPDAVQRGVCGEVLHRFERAGFNIVGMKLIWATIDIAKEHYSEHVKKSFYPGLEKGITEKPVIAICFEGIEAVENVRRLVGPTIPKDAPPGTIRGDFAHHTIKARDCKGLSVANLIHASSNNEEAAKEISIWFKPEELIKYGKLDDCYTF